MTAVPINAPGAANEVAALPAQATLQSAPVFPRARYPFIRAESVSLPEAAPLPARLFDLEHSDSFAGFPRADVMPSDEETGGTTVLRPVVHRRN